MDILRRQFGERIIDFVDLRGARQIGYEHADQVARNILTRFDNGEFDVATLFYSRFKSVISQIPTAQRIIPAEIEAGGGGASEAVYDFEPEEGEILASLLPRNLTIQVFRALLENAASEQGARMSAMDSATRNAGDMIKKQTTLYNRSRQAMITKELIEIISGAEAL
jgi:F-type H+-transporting ATPase subunit gamma